MNALVEARGLRKYFPAKTGLLNRTGPTVRAIESFDLVLHRGQTIGLVGESGCGKSTAARLLLRLIDTDAGSLHFDGQDITNLNATAMRPIRRRMQMVFQDPYASLNPRRSIGQTIEEMLSVHRADSDSERRRKVLRTLSQVGLSADLASRYPHELSGGQRQRVAIARALVLEPEVIIADEPVSALDVSIQAQILNLLTDLQQSLNIAYVIVSHDLAVIEHLCDQVAVMYLGRIVEQADAVDLCAQPLHPYTEALLASVPSIVPGRKADSRPLEGEVPSPMNPPRGCPFHPRCPHRSSICSEVAPQLAEAFPGRWVACHLHRVT